LGSVSIVYASPGPTQGRGELICDVQAQARALRKLLRHPKSFGGPLATRPARARLALKLDLTEHMRRAKHTSGANEAAAIHNDAPAARVAAEDQAPPSLESLGFLAGPVDSHPLTHDCSPRSPRGPPSSV